MVFLASREVAQKFSNSDANPVRIRLTNLYSFIIHTDIIDEIPEQFQKERFFKILDCTGKFKR